MQAAAKVALAQKCRKLAAAYSRSRRVVAYQRSGLLSLTEWLLSAAASRRFSPFRQVQSDTASRDSLKYRKLSFSSTKKKIYANSNESPPTHTHTHTTQC